MQVGANRSNGRYQIQAEINMVPLIDVALVLLIIFMVISPILVESQMQVKLPKVTSAGAAEETAIKVNISADGSFEFNGKIVTKSALFDQMQSALSSDSKPAVLIRADKDTAFDHVVYVMDIAKQLKAEKLGVSVIPLVGAQ